MFLTMNLHRALGMTFFLVSPIYFFQFFFGLLTCKGHDTVVSLSAGDDKKPAEA